jgi:hypothetical protein
MLFKIATSLIYQMTEKEEVEQIKLRKKFARTFDDYISYVFFVAPIGFIIIGYSMITNYFKFNNPVNILISGISIFAFGLTTVFFFFRKFNENIKFETISISPDMNIDVLADKLNVEFGSCRLVINKTLQKIELITNTSALSWGEQVTLLFDSDTILINSRPIGKQPFTIFQDKQNIRKIKKLL